MLGYQLPPLMPIYVLLPGAALILVVGPFLASDRRHWLAVAASAVAALSLPLVSGGPELGSASSRVLTQWQGEVTLVLRLVPFDSFLWALILSLLAILLGGRSVARQVRPPSGAMPLVLTAAAAAVLISGNPLSLVFTLFIFDGVSALYLVVHRRMDGAVGRLLLAVLSGAAIIVVTQGAARPPGGSLELGSLFSLIIWLRLGLYPLVELGARDDWPLSIGLGWTMPNLVVGLHLIPSGVAPWIVWLAGPTMALHGLLAWLEPRRERALTHSAYGLGGGVLAMAAVVGGYSPQFVAASLSLLAALVVLVLTPVELGRPNSRQPWLLLAYLPPALATASLVGIPFTLGWMGRGGLYGAAWEIGASGIVALVIIGEGAALSVIFRYWRRLLGGASRDKIDIWRVVGGGVIALVFLIPLLGPRLLSRLAASSSDVSAVGAQLVGPALGLIGSMLWAFFLGYGRRRLLSSMPLSAEGLINVLRLGWLLRGAEQVLDALGRSLLRLRAIIEGEHYLAWAILLTIGLVLLLALQ